MCEECGQIKCLGNCPNNSEEEREYCFECGKILERGDEVYINNDDEAICLECFEQMENKKIAKFFGLSKEVI